jgi:hypothetical protein
MGQRVRQPALDAAKRAQIVTVLSMGCSQNRAAQFVGCSPSTIQRTAEHDPKFAAELRKAKCDAELGLVKNIRSAAQKDQYWRAAAWALERGFPEKYARHGPDVITVEQVGLLLARFSEIIVGEVSERSRKRILKQIDTLARSFGCDLKKEPHDDPQ